MLVLFGILLNALPVHADAPQVLTIQNHVFTPNEIHVKANAKAQITVKNLDSTAEEFDSDDLKVEKVVAGKSEGVVHLKPLKPGRYNFVGEYHEDTAKGVVVAE